MSCRHDPVFAATETYCGDCGVALGVKDWVGFPVTLAGAPVVDIETRRAVCAQCGGDDLIHVEDIPATRSVRGFADDGRLDVDSEVEDHCYESGHDAVIECRGCCWQWTLAEIGGDDALAWDGE